MAGPATKLIGNLLARLPAGEGITGPGTEKKGAWEKIKMYSPQDSGQYEHMREICVVGVSVRGRQSIGIRGTREG